LLSSDNQKTCIQCNSALTQNAKFCAECGTAIAEPPPIVESKEESLDGEHDWQKTKSDITEQIRLEPADSSLYGTLYARRAMCCHYLGQYEQALDDMDKAREVGRQFDWAPSPRQFGLGPQDYRPILESVGWGGLKDKGYNPLESLLSPKAFSTLSRIVNPNRKILERHDIYHEALMVFNHRIHQWVLAEILDNPNNTIERLFYTDDRDDRKSSANTMEKTSDEYIGEFKRDEFKLWGALLSLWVRRTRIFERAPSKEELLQGYSRPLRLADAQRRYGTGWCEICFDEPVDSEEPPPDKPPVPGIYS